MPEDERTLRMNHLRRRERIYDVNYWMKSFLQVMGSLEEHDSVGATTMQPVTMDDFDDYLNKYVSDVLKDVHDWARPEHALEIFEMKREIYF